MSMFMYIFHKQSRKSVFVKRCSEKYTANLQETTHAMFDFNKFAKQITTPRFVRN